MLCYLNDTGALLQYTDKASPAGWLKPWALPWGEVFHAAASEGMTPGPVVVTGTNVVFPVANRRYLAQWRCQATKDGAAGNPKYTFQTNLGLGNFAQQTMQGGWVASIALTDHFISAAGVTTVFVIVEGGGGSVATTEGRFIVTDVGPA